MNKNLQAQTSNSEQIVVSHQFSGPIPPPDTLAKYDSIVAGAAERILKMAENEATARIRNEEKLIENEVILTKNTVRSSYLGVFFAFASVVLLTALAWFALTNDYPAVASGIIVVIASVAGIFILFRNRYITNLLILKTISPHKTIINVRKKYCVRVRFESFPIHVMELNGR